MTRLAAALSFALATAGILGGLGCKSECLCGPVDAIPMIHLGGYNLGGDDVGEIISANDPNPCEIDVDFGILPVGRPPATAFIDIVNTGPDALDLSQVIPNLDPEFGLTYDIQESIKPGTLGEFTVTFQPYDAGQVSSTFTIETDGQNEGCPEPGGESYGDVLTVVLAGTGS